MSDGLLIEAIDLEKIYRMGEVRVAALDGVSLCIQSGEFLAIMGPSGSGKSTLMNILGCLDRPSAGQYILTGEDVSRLSREKLAHIRNEKIGFIFQSYNLLPQATTLQNVMLPMAYSKNGSRRSKSARIEHARKTLESVGLTEREKHLPTELSGGQQQRVAIARALINDPLLILADEPTGNLDSKSGGEIMGVLRDLHTRGRTIVMVTHDHEIAAYAQRTIHMLDGKIEQEQITMSEPASEQIGAKHEPIRNA